MSVADNILTWCCTHCKNSLSLWFPLAGHSRSVGSKVKSSKLVTFTREDSTAWAPTQTQHRPICEKCAASSGLFGDCAQHRMSPSSLPKGNIKRLGWTPRCVLKKNLRFREANAGSILRPMPNSRPPKATIYVYIKCAQYAVMDLVNVIILMIFLCDYLNHMYTKKDICMYVHACVCAYTLPAVAPKTHLANP